MQISSNKRKKHTTTIDHLIFACKISCRMKTDPFHLRLFSLWLKCCSLLIVANQFSSFQQFCVKEINEEREKEIKGKQILTHLTSSWVEIFFFFFPSQPLRQRAQKKGEIRWYTSAKERTRGYNCVHAKKKTKQSKIITIILQSLSNYLAKRSSDFNAYCKWNGEKKQNWIKCVRLCVCAQLNRFRSLNSKSEKQSFLLIS